MNEAALRKLKRDLAAALRRLRDESHLSTTELATRTGWSQSKVSKIENAVTKPSAEDVLIWGLHTGAAPELIDQLAADAARSGRVHRSWRTSLNDGIAARQREMAELETSAVRARIFTPSTIPGLLQVPAYAERILALIDPGRTAGEIAAGVAARMNRQTALFHPDTEWLFVIGEGGLLWRPDGLPAGAARAQADRLLMLAGMSNVRVAVLPYEVDWPVLPLEAVSIYDTHGGEVIAVAESSSDELVLTGADETRLWVERFDAVLRVAIEGPDAMKLVRARLARAS